MVKDIEGNEIKVGDLCIVIGNGRNGVGCGPDFEDYGIAYPEAEISSDGIAHYHQMWTLVEIVRIDEDDNSAMGRCGLCILQFVSGKHLVRVGAI